MIRLKTINVLLPIIVIITGFGFFVFGIFQPRYHNEQEYVRRYMALEGPSRSSRFYELRHASLTSSIRNQDYGLTAFSIGIVLVLGTRWRQLVPILPARKITVFAFGGVAALITTAAQVGSLFVDYSRGEFPHWADSVGIPLSSLGVVSIVLLFWAGIHSLFVDRRNTEESLLTFDRSNWWFALLIAATVLVLLGSAVFGDFWQILPSTLWILFYFSIWISRSVNLPSNHGRSIL